jgi:hypothetical protein
MRFHPRQAVTKKIVDAQHREVIAWRYECAQCGCTFRVYPQRVSKKQVSKRVLGMAIMLYVLGLSYGAVEIVLSSLGVGIGKTSIYRAVQAAAEKVPGMKREKLLDGYRAKAWLEPILDALDADVMVSDDDADGFKIVSDVTGRAHSGYIEDADPHPTT